MNLFSCFEGDGCMKTKHRTAADYGIEYTGKELNEFNKKFLNSCKNESNTKNGVIALFAVVFAGLGAWIAWERCEETAARIVMTALPLVTLAAVCVLCFSRKDYACRQMQYVLILCLLPLFAITAASAGKGTMVDYAIHMLALAGFVACGLRLWSKVAVKQVGRDEDTAADSANKFSFPSFAVAVVTVAVVSLLNRAVKSAAVKSVAATIAVLVLTALTGFAAGIGWGNARYFRFLNGK